MDNSQEKRPPWDDISYGPVNKGIALSGVICIDFTVYWLVAAPGVLGVRLLGNGATEMTASL